MTCESLACRAPPAFNLKTLAPVCIDYFDLAIFFARKLSRDLAETRGELTLAAT